MALHNESICFTGSHGSLSIKSDDIVTKKILMIIEGECMGVCDRNAAKKYGYSRQHYYIILNSFKENGVAGLMNKQPGPKKNYVRTKKIVHQIIRHRFLDPDTSAAVIAQKMRQSGYNVSHRSVERTITEYGLQKKTPFIKSGKRGRGS